MITDISYNARYAKLREVKKAHFPDFWRSASAGSFSGLVQPFCTFCKFYHILWFYLSHAYRCFLCYALLHRFVCNLFYSSKHLCACFITFHAAFYDLQFAAVVVHLFLCGHYFARFYQIVSMDVPTYMMLTAYNANYKDP